MCVHEPIVPRGRHEAHARPGPDQAAFPVYPVNPSPLPDQETGQDHPEEGIHPDGRPLPDPEGKVQAEEGC